MYFKGIVIVVVVATLLVIICKFTPMDDIFIELVDLKASPDRKYGKGFCNDDAAAVKFRDQIVDLEEAQKVSQNFSTLVSEIGRRYTTIILYLDQGRDLNKQALSSIFLAAVSEENLIRKCNPKLEPIQVFLHLSVTACTSQKSQFHKINDLVVGIASYIEKDDTVRGVIFDNSLIKTYIPEKYGSYRKKTFTHLSFTIRKLKKSLQHAFGYELQFGLAFNSFQECTTDLASDVGNRTSSFDMVIINAIQFLGTAQGKNRTVERAHFENCVQILRKNILKFYLTREVHNLKN